MESVLPVLMPTLFVLFVVLLVYIHKTQNRDWTMKAGILCDISELTMLETIEFSKKMPICADAVLAEVAKYPELRGMEFRVRVIPSNTPVGKDHLGNDAAATVRFEREGLWGKKFPVALCTFKNEKRDEWWYDYIAHEVFAHITYCHEGQIGKNYNHKQVRWIDAENRLKRRLRELLYESPLHRTTIPSCEASCLAS